MKQSLKADSVFHIFYVQMRKVRSLRFARLRILLLIAAALLLCGCASPSPLGSRLFVENAGIDSTDAGVALSINAYLADVENDADNGAFLRQEGFSITGATEGLALRTGREPYFPHNCAVVIGRDAAQTGIDGILNFFNEYIGCRGGAPLFVADSTAAQLLEAVNTCAELDTRALGDLADPDMHGGRTVYTPVIQAAAARADGAADFCAPLLAAADNQVSVTGTALFSGGRMTAQLTPEQTVGLHLITGELRSAAVYVSLREYGRVTLAVRVVRAHQTVQGSAQSGFQFTLHAECTAKITECGFAAVNPDDGRLAQLLETDAERQLTAWANSAVALAQAANAEPFGFRQLLRQEQPRIWAALNKATDPALRHYAFDAEVRVQMMAE